MREWELIPVFTCRPMFNQNSIKKTFNWLFFCHEIWLINWKMFYNAFNIISVISLRQLTYSSIPCISSESTRLRLWNVLPKDSPTKCELNRVRLQPVASRSHVSYTFLHSHTRSKCLQSKEIIANIRYLTHSLIHHFDKVQNSRKLQTTTEIWLFKDFKIPIA